jgi:phosphoribosylglycinamide formyltransferase-1
VKKNKLAILASGSGSNAEAIMKWAERSELASVVCVISDKKSAMVLERAKKFNVPAVFVQKKKAESREDFDQKILSVLSDYDPDWIILAGYMKLVTKIFLDAFKEKVINIHPSLLPLFPGTNGYGEAFEAGMSETGCTIHYVDEGVDTGKIIDQRKFPLIRGESFEDFKARGLKIENEFYPEVIEKLLSGSI